MTSKEQKLSDTLESWGVDVCGNLNDWNDSSSEGLWVSLESGALAQFGYCCFSDEYFESKIGKAIDKVAFLEAYDSGTAMIYFN